MAGVFLIFKFNAIAYRKGGRVGKPKKCTLSTESFYGVCCFQRNNLGAMAMTLAMGEHGVREMNG